MVELAFEIKKELESHSLKNFGAMLDENWRLKSQLANGITDPQIDDWYQKGMTHGAALGGKILGADNGRCILFFAPPETHDRIKKAILIEMVLKSFFINLPKDRYCD